jgi:Transposase and inactivated derivatives, IS30 family
VARLTPLTDDDRDQIMIAVARDESFREIGRALGRHHSVVGREVGRNGGRHEYRSRVASERAVLQRARWKARKLESDERLHDVVAEGLAAEWSPRQISERLVVDFPDEPEMRVSHETVYETLFVQARGECRTQLKLALRSGRTRVNIQP